MTPRGFRSALIAIGAVAGLLTCTQEGVIFSLICAAWLCVRFAPAAPHDEILCALAEGRMYVKKFPGLTDE